jgi:hypothetical protein
VIGVASIIVKLTPTLKDDDILLPIIKFIGKYIALKKLLLQPITKIQLPIKLATIAFV